MGNSSQPPGSTQPSPSTVVPIVTSHPAYAENRRAAASSHAPLSPPDVTVRHEPAPLPAAPPPHPPTGMTPARLRLVEISSHAFFSMWKTRMAEERSRGEATEGGDSTFEFVAADHRLQYLELLKLDGAVEIQFVSMDDEDTFLGAPSNCRSTLSWRVSPGGWICVPKDLDPDAHRVQLSNRWWAGLKQCLNPALRGLMRYDLFEARFLRLFITPVPGEECVRAIVTTNMPVVVRDLLERGGHSHGGEFLSKCVIARPPGEFPATLDDLFDGNRLEHQADMFRDPELIRLVPPAGGTGDQLTGSVDSPDGEAREDQSSNPCTAHSCPVATSTQQTATTATAAACTVSMATTLEPPNNTAASTSKAPQDTRPQPSLLDRGPARPLPMLVRQTSAGAHAQPTTTHLFPHQQRTVSWMLDVEAGMCDPLFVPQSVLFGTSNAYHRGVWYDVRERSTDFMLSAKVECLCAAGGGLPLGGVVAHPVGSGKTVIAAEVISRTRHLGPTAVYVPPHITRQWHSELLRFVPGIRVEVVGDTIPLHPITADVLIIPHNLTEANGATRRWLLTATPDPLTPMMLLALGLDTTVARTLPYDSMLFWFSRTRCRRDPPFLCLPVPPLQVHMHPVTLQWQEMSVLHSFTLQDDLQSAIRLASFFHLVHRGGGEGGGLHGAKTFVSMDDWVHQHREALLEELTAARMELSRLERQVTFERSAYAEEMKRRGVAEGVARIEASGATADVIRIADVVDEEDVGVSFVLLQERRWCEQECRHPGEATGLPQDRHGEHHPGGRVHDLHERAGRPRVEDHTQQTYGSKIACVTAQLLTILDTHPEDKVLVFGQWQDLLRQMCLAMPTGLQYCFLDGPLSQRCDTIEEFRSNPMKRVLILSSESQSSGANLEVANHVIIVHPYCPPGVTSVGVVPLAQAQAFEQQAIGRVLRFPQSKPVHVYRFYSVGTPEEELYIHWGNLPAVYKSHEDDKKTSYGQRVHDIEHAVFTPLVLSTSGAGGDMYQHFIPHTQSIT
ncbi:hypothetical protein EMCRGX_G010325 [Ephydatia muelleri]